MKAPGFLYRHRSSSSNRILEDDEVERILNQRATSSNTNSGTTSASNNGAAAPFRRSQSTGDQATKRTLRRRQRFNWNTPCPTRCGLPDTSSFRRVARKHLDNPRAMMQRPSWKRQSLDPGMWLAKERRRIIR